MTTLTFEEMGNGIVEVTINEGKYSKTIKIMKKNVYWIMELLGTTLIWESMSRAKTMTRHSIKHVAIIINHICAR